MRPLEIISKLGTLKSDKAKGNVLSKIEPEHEFWPCVYHGCRPLVPYKVPFALSDPLQYGNGVPLGVFPKILAGIENGQLDAVSTVDAISAFCGHCTQEEWAQWYRPILDKRLRLPVALRLYNDHAPEEWRVHNFNAPALVPVEEIKGFPPAFVLEPHLGVPRLFLFLKNKRSFVFTEDGSPTHRMLPTAYERFMLDEGAVVEVYEDGEDLIARDLLLEVQMLDPEQNTSYVDSRLQILSSVLTDPDAVIEHDIYSAETGIREAISLHLESGYPGVVLRPIGFGYHHENANILIHPTKKNTLTCTDVVAGADGTKWEGRAEYLRGTGSRQGKKIDTLVFHGLTFDERSTCLENREDLIGKKFEVVSCGLSTEKSLLFPVFKRWKE